MSYSGVHRVGSCLKSNNSERGKKGMGYPILRHLCSQGYRHFLKENMSGFVTGVKKESCLL